MENQPRFTQAAGRAVFGRRAPRMSGLMAGVCIWLGGCTVGPDYKPPASTLADRYGEATTRPAVEVDLTRWWTTFNDSTLDSLVIRATESNLDLQLAAARVREARAARGAVYADYFPTVDADGFYERSRSSKTSFSSFPGQPTETDLFQVGFDATWELDVFGGVRRAVEAADADVQAAVEGRRDVLVTLLGDVARNYIELRGRQKQLAINRANLASQRETLDLTRARFNAGLVGELDVARAEALVAQTSSQIPLLDQSAHESIHRLGVLLGREPSALLDELGPDGPIPAGVAAVPLGLPSELLRRRPDIRQAERRLAAQTALIGVATADLFPKFSLTGSIGHQSAKWTNLPDGDSLFWGVGPAFRWNVFDAGKIRSAIAVQDARQQQALIEYEQIVLRSLEEVENAIVALDREQTRRVSLASAVAANRRAVDLANQLYARGLVDFLNVQESQRSLLIAEEQLAQSDLRSGSNLVALYKALGGGWDPDAQDSGEPTTRPTPDGRGGSPPASAVSSAVVQWRGG